MDEERGKRANISICQPLPGSSINIYANGNNYLHFFKHTQRRTHTTGLRQLREELLHLLVKWTLVGGWTVVRAGGWQQQQQQLPHPSPALADERRSTVAQWVIVGTKCQAEY